MENYSAILMNSPLFESIGESELTSLLDCLDAKVVTCQKDELVFVADNPAKHVGLVLEGSVQVISDDIFGNRTILAALFCGELFGETFACAGINTLPVSVVAATKSLIMLLDYRRIITTCPASCSFHSRLIENMLKILAQKNILLNQKINAVSARTTKDKLMAYLLSQAAYKKSTKFEIPFNRQELADYLSVDRSALSREMSFMKQAGVIDYSKNCFEILSEY